MSLLLEALFLPKPPSHPLEFTHVISFHLETVSCTSLRAAGIACTNARRDVLPLDVSLSCQDARLKDGANLWAQADVPEGRMIVTLVPRSNLTFHLDVPADINLQDFLEEVTAKSLSGKQWQWLHHNPRLGYRALRWYP